MNRFNLRVYGILINDRNEVLLSRERRNGHEFTKFPGGGLEFGEGIKDCLQREFREELDIDIAAGELFYVTDFFQQSAFHKDHQLISFYYTVAYPDWQLLPIEELKAGTEDQETFFWVPVQELTEELVTFPVDKVVVGRLTYSQQY